MKKLSLKHMLFLVVCGIGMAGTVAQANSMNVQTHTKEEIRAYINGSQSSITSATTYKVKPSVKNYAIGQLSEETVTSALARLNQYRYIAGLDANVTSDATYAEYAQAAALINAVHGGLSHSPAKPSGMSDSTYQLCKKGAGSSNLAAGYGSLPNSIDGWINEAGLLGHRRWLLYPKLGKTGFGLVNNVNSMYGSYSAVYVFDRSNDSDYKNVAWPAQLTPLSYFSEYDTWSLSTGNTETASNVKVTLTRKSDKKKWTFTSSNGLTVDNTGYGQRGCIIFCPNGISSFKDGDVYTVNITGLVDGDLTYNVEFFNLKETSDPLKSKVSGFKAVAGTKKLTLKWKKKSGIDGYQIQISTSKSYSKKQTYTVGKSKTSKTITKYNGKKLKSKKKYYVRIRAYKKVTNADGTTTKKYSKWKSISKKTK